MPLLFRRVKPFYLLYFIFLPIRLQKAQKALILCGEGITSSAYKGRDNNSMSLRSLLKSSILTSKKGKAPRVVCLCAFKRRIQKPPIAFFPCAKREKNNTTKVTKRGRTKANSFMVLLRLTIMVLLFRPCMLVQSTRLSPER